MHRNAPATIVAVAFLLLAGLDAREIQRRIDAAASLAVAGDDQGAPAAYRDLLSRAPALTSICLEVGRLHGRLNEKPEALTACRRLLALELAGARAKAEVERSAAQ